MNLNDATSGSPRPAGGNLAMPVLASSAPDEAHPMDTLLAGNLGMTMPSQGDIREGIVARITPGEILVDVGAKSEGVISGRELERMDLSVRDGLQVGQKILVYVVSPEDRNGNIVLSFARAQEEKDWRDAEQLLASQSVFDGQVAGFNKGGLIVRVGNVRGFVPASQFSPARRRRVEGETPEQRFGRMVGEAVTAKVIEVDRSRNRLILSERAATKETREAQRERLLSELRKGDTRTGRVISLAEFGAFVDLGGADGLVHVSEMTWKRIVHPRELLKVGQEVQVVVLNVDPERKRIALSMKRLEDDPWTRIARKYQPGQLVRGVITKLAKFGAFASLVGDEEIEGLIHISELADGHVSHPKEIVQPGQDVTLRILRIDPEKRRMGLSLKRVAKAEYEEADLQWAVEPPPRAAEDDDYDEDEFDDEDDYDEDEEP